jgi:hypothetical protein
MRVLVRNPRITLSYLPYATLPRVYTREGRIVQLDALSYRVWELSDGALERGELVEMVSREHGLPAPAVERVVERLLKLGLLVEVELQ